MSISVLQTSDLLKCFDEKALKQLLDEQPVQTLHAGDTLFKQGDTGEALYIVLSGRLRVTITKDDTQETIGEIGQGGTVGEMALIDDGVRTASVSAIRESRLLELSKSYFLQLIEKDPSTLWAVAQIVIQRYKKMQHHHGWPDAVKTLAWLNIGDCPQSESLINGLLHAEYWDANKPPLLIEPTHEWLEIASDPLKFSKKLQVLESRHALIIMLGLESGAKQTAEVINYWNQLILSHADRNWLVTDNSLDIAEASHEIQQLHLQKTGAQWELVLMNTALMPVASRLKALHPYKRIHQLSGTNHTTCQQLVRWLTGQAIGLVLGGGGARGFAHIGVIKALEEHGIPVDVIGGTSMGALIGAFYTQGISPSDIQAIMQKVLVDQNPLSDLTLPLVSLTSGKRVKKLLKAELGIYEIEDLPKPFFCMSSNISKNKAVKHDTGLLWRWVRTSIALPGIIPPTIHNGDIYIDGGVLDNLPITSMLETGVGRLIAVNVASSGALSMPGDNVDGLSVRQYLQTYFKRRKNSKKSMPRDELPDLMTILFRAGTASSDHQVDLLRQNRQIDCLIDIPLEHYGMLDWHHIADIVEIGYEATCDQIQRGSL